MQSVRRGDPAERRGAALRCPLPRGGRPARAGSPERGSRATAASHGQVPARPRRGCVARLVLAGIPASPLQPFLDGEGDEEGLGRQSGPLRPSSEDPFLRVRKSAQIPRDKGVSGVESFLLLLLLLGESLALAFQKQFCPENHLAPSRGLVVVGLCFHTVRVPLGKGLF